MEQALDYCEGLELAENSDWRLPNRNELQSIAESSMFTFFPSMDYWSSTTNSLNANHAWYVGSDSNIASYTYKSNYYYVRAVRGPSFGDSDCDGTFDDADNSGIVGDTPCTGGETVNCDDNCRFIPNPDQADADSDSVGDACDNCPVDNNTFQSDIDGDGIGNVCDNCPDDPDNDIDNDTICGDVDNCPTVYNSGQTDTDNDTIGNVCDNCPDAYNAEQDR